MEKTKAGLRALREGCGMTQADLAAEFDVEILSVKRWENPDKPHEVPDPIFSWLSELYTELNENAMGIARSIAADGIKSAVLPYFRTQEDLDEIQLPLGQDQPIGFFNAMMRRCADFLSTMGVDVSFGYGAEATVIPFSDLILDNLME